MQLRSRTIVANGEVRNKRKYIEISQSQSTTVFDCNIMNRINWLGNHIGKIASKLSELNALGRENEKYIIMEKMRLCHELYYSINYESLDHILEYFNDYYNHWKIELDKLLKMYVSKSTEILQQLKIYICNNLHDGKDTWSTEEIQYSEGVLHELEKCKSTSLKLLDVYKNMTP